MDPIRLREAKMQLRRHMNGVTAEIMKSMDGSYAQNYGLSLQHIRDVARSLDLSPDECDDLWRTRWRDLMLVAAAAIAPRDPAPERILEWAEGVPSLELVSLLPFLVAGRMSAAADLACRLVARGRGYDFAIAANVVANALVGRPDDAALAEAAGMVLRAAPGRMPWPLAEGAAVGLLCRRAARAGVAAEAVEAVRKAAVAAPADNMARCVAQEIADEAQMLAEAGS